MSPESQGASYSYALIRVVPRVERGECINVGVVLFCAARAFLGARAILDAARLRALSTELDLDAVERHLQALLQIVAGDHKGGPIAELPAGERFHWLSAPRSTIIQPAPVHGGVTDDPQSTLDDLFSELVLTHSSSERELPGNESSSADDLTEDA
jgi:hypothetical protein